MAEYVVTFVADQIARYLIEEAQSLSQAHNHIAKVEAELRRMQCFLKDADFKQHEDERVKNWVADIRDVAYDAEDVIEYFISRVAQQRRKGFMSLFKRYFLMNELVLQHKVNNQIKRIETRIQDIAKSRSTYGIENFSEGSKRAGFEFSRLQEKRRMNSFADEEDIVGLVEDTRMIKSKLIHGDSCRSVISIVGMAGIGKTTLVKKVYLSYDVKIHFDCSAWICVSQEYKTSQILRDLGKNLLGLAKVELDHWANEDLVNAISTFLEDKKYLVILDDIWGCEVWDDLKAALPDKNNGSRVVLTTRIKEVSLYADPRSPPHVLSLLNDEDSWELFSRKVCVVWDSSEKLPPRAEELGKQIVNSCGGLPLAIVVLAGLLSRKQATFIEWQKVLQSLHWQLKQDTSRCTEILALSYKDLPGYLKPCFLYFGLFPEDFEISARRLTLLWVAEGFVLPRGREPIEDVAEDYLEELVSRSIVQVVKRTCDGRIKACGVHDLLRELSISMAKQDRFLDVIHGDISDSFGMNARRLSIHFGIPPTKKNIRKVRSLFCFDLKTTQFDEVKKYRLLRILDLEGIHLSHLDSAIGKLIHLRYLGLRATWLRHLPSAIKYLLNLQTLDLRSTSVNPIPREIWKLQNLRNLYLNELNEMVVNPPKGATLPSLQTLHGVCIGMKSRMACGLDGLTSIRQLVLHGELHMQEEALAKWIFMSKNLECLKLKRAMSPDTSSSVYVPLPKFMSFSDHNRLTKLHIGGFLKNTFDVEDFSPNIAEIALEDTFSLEDPMPKLGKLPNLQVLKLKHASYMGKELVCSGGSFPQLHFLKLSFLLVQKWRIEEGALSKLRELEIVECKQIKIVPKGLQPVTSLRELKLGYMPRDFERRVEERQGEDWYRIQNVPPL